MKKKILIFGPYKKGQDKTVPGGIVRWLFSFINSPQVNGYDIEVVDLSIVGNRYKKTNIFKRINNEIKRARRINRDTNNAIKNNSFSLAHFHSSCGRFGVIRDYLLLKKLKKRKIKIITHFHCNVHLHANRGWLTKMYFRKIVAISTKIIVLNDLSREHVLILDPDANVIKVPNFIKLEEVIKTPKKINKTIDNVVFIGFIQKEKGIYELYEVARLFPEINFRLIGYPSLEFKKIVPPHNVYILEGANRETIFNELDSADLFLFPSHTEGFSLALLEAMARGLPIVCTNVGENREMIGTNCGGVITKVNSIEEIVDAIILMHDKELRASCSRYNIEKVKETYTEEKVINTILKIYNEYI